ncbi:MAG: hypothetical protein PHP02_01380 [Eubacteriales bacterium]|nr:hypothetical protein [Eubacteriales bacterium]
MSAAALRAGVIIIGSNSTRMLTASLDAGLSGPISGRMETRLFLALGEGKRLRLDAIQAACRDVAALYRQAREAGAERTWLLATSAVRESENGKDLAYALLQETGLALQVLSGEEEAAYSFWGAVHPFSRHEMAGVVDIGGGSTEIALGRPGDMPLGHSLPMGASRLYATQPINSPEEAEKAIAIALETAREGVGAMAHKTLTLDSRHWADPTRWLLVGGTGTALIGLLKGRFYERGEGDMAFSRGEVLATLHALSVLPPQARAALPGMTPGREHILPTGLAVLAALMEALGLGQMAVTSRNNTDGVLWRLAAKGSLRME